MTSRHPTLSYYRVVARARGRRLFLFPWLGCCRCCLDVLIPSGVVVEVVHYSDRDLGTRCISIRWLTESPKLPPDLRIIPPDRLALRQAVLETLRPVEISPPLVWFTDHNLDRHWTDRTLPLCLLRCHHRQGGDLLLARPVFFAENKHPVDKLAVVTAQCRPRHPERQCGWHSYRRLNSTSILP